MLRPHPAFWRWVLGCGLLYAIAMAFALFQNVNDLRQWVRYLDPATIKGTNPLAEKSYVFHDFPGPLAGTAFISHLQLR